MARHLVAQAETQKPSSTGHYFGYEVFDVDGDFFLVIHTQTYDGTRRASHHATPEQKLDAPTKETAIAEATAKTVAYVNAVLGPGDETTG
jgi:hypothetical protein